MTPYQREQIKSLEVVRKHWSELPEAESAQLRSLIADSLAFTTARDFCASSGWLPGRDRRLRITPAQEACRPN